MVLVGCLEDAQSASLPLSYPLLALFGRFRVEVDRERMVCFNHIKRKHMLISRPEITYYL